MSESKWKKTAMSKRDAARPGSDGLKGPATPSKRKTKRPALSARASKEPPPGSAPQGRPQPEHPHQNALKLTAHFANLSPEDPPPFAPKSFDHRFDHPAWSTPPFLMWQQGFLAMQDWWDHATDPLRALAPEDADRTRFMERQALLDLSPHNCMVRYLVGQGFTVFMISWCNPTAEQADLPLEDYRKSGVMAALDVVGRVVGPEDWLAKSTPYEGSWWPGWKSWLEGPTPRLARALQHPDRERIGPCAIPA